MSGFGLYETLRILIPGTFVVGLTSLVLRLATGQGHHLSGGPFGGVIGGLSGAAFAVAAVATGFLLYLLDLASQTRLNKGDPANQVELPTDFLASMFRQAELPVERSFSSYFLLSDAHLPEETHRRVYFFGGIYRIFVDARVVTAAAYALAGPLSVVVAGTAQPTSSVATDGCMIVLTVLLVVLLGENRHRIQSVSKRERRLRKEAADPEADVYAEALREYRHQRRRGMREMTVAWGLILFLGTSGLLAVTDERPHWRAVGFACVAGAVWLWALVDFGPPLERTSRHAGARQFLLTRLMRLRPSSAAQYSPLQRGMADLALFLPSTLGLLLSAGPLGRSPEELAAWALVVVTATLIMAIRKHEIRLLSNFKDQVNWLILNQSKIIRLVAQGPPDGDWS